MSVYKHRNSPFWHFDFQLNNYRFSGSTEIPVDRPRREAETVEAQERRAAERLVEEVRRSGRKPLTLKAACDRWWSEVGQHGKESDLRGILDWLCDQIGGDRLLHTIGADDITKAVAARRQHRVKAGRDDNGKQLYRPVKARTVNRTVPLPLKRVFRRARANWDAVIFKEPIWRDFLLAETKRQIREITHAEELAMAAVEGSYHAIRRLTVIMGLRKREALLTWPQVDFENAQVRIIGKGGIPRIVPMSREAYELLWAERDRHPMWVFTYVAEKTHPRHQKGQGSVRGERYPITYAGLTSHHRRAWKAAGITARYHDLRHTAGMRTLRATGNLKVTQKLLGHSDVATTSRFYVDAMVEDVRAAMEATAAPTTAGGGSLAAECPPPSEVPKARA
jgi:integrase